MKFGKSLSGLVEIKPYKAFYVSYSKKHSIIAWMPWDLCVCVGAQKVVLLAEHTCNLHFGPQKYWSEFMSYGFSQAYRK